MNRAACALKSELVSIPIRETLAIRRLDCKRRPFPIIVAECGSGVITKIEFCEVAVQMLLGAMLVNAAHWEARKKVPQPSYRIQRPKS
jgi:hypothetical protein